MTWRTRQVSPGKNTVFPPTYPPHLLSAAFDSKDFALFCKLIQLPLASIGVREPRAGSLPLASFGFRVAADTLALSYGYCYLHRSGLSPYGQRPCRAHKKRAYSQISEYALLGIKLTCLDGEHLVNHRRCLGPGGVSRGGKRLCVTRSIQKQGRSGREVDVFYWY